MRTSSVLSLVVVAVIILMLGIAVGSVLFPTIVTQNVIVTEPVRAHQVTFLQNPCNPNQYVSPWSVKLGNETVVKPYNETVSYPGVVKIKAYPNNSNIISSITFSVPDGVYSYTISPQGFDNKTFGIVSVDGSDVSIPLWVGCHP